MARSRLSLSKDSLDIPNNIGNVGAAFGLSSLGDSFAAMQRNKPDYGKIGAAAIGAESAKRRAVLQANSSTKATKFRADAFIEAARLNAQARGDAAEAQEKESEKGIWGSIISGGVGLIASTLLSDETTKNNIEQIDDALATLRELRPVTFYYNEEYSSSPERLHHGFIAQEYAKHMPDATYYDESIDKLCIDTTELIALLVRSVQQLETKVARMEAQTALAGVKS